MSLYVAATCKVKQLLCNVLHVPIAINGHVKANTVACQQIRPSDCIDPLRSMKIMSSVAFSVQFLVYVHIHHRGVFQLQK